MTPLVVTLTATALVALERFLAACADEHRRADITGRRQALRDARRPTIAASPLARVAGSARAGAPTPARENERTVA